MTSGWSLLRHFVRARRRPRFGSRAELLHWQDAQVQAHLERILPSSPYYRRLFKELPRSEWLRAPLLDKARMLANFDQLNTAGIPLDEALAVALESEASREVLPLIGDISVSLSPGTSGSRAVFLANQEERDDWLAMALERVLPRAPWSPHQIALFVRSHPHLAPPPERGPLRLSYYPLDDPLEQHSKRLNRQHPGVLIAPPSMLRYLAEAQSEDALAIHPERVISTAEVLDPGDEAAIRTQFGQVHQFYMCAEGFLGSSCSHGTLHLHEHRFAIQREYVDEARRIFVPIITDFSRTVQPLLRYRLDDLLTERATPCPCGSVMTGLARLEGRLEDVFYWRSSSPGPLVPVFPDEIRAAVAGASRAILEYQVLQHSPTLMEVALRVPDEQETEAEEQVVGALHALARGKACDVSHVRFMPYLHVPSERKLRRITRRYTPEPTPAS